VKKPTKKRPPQPDPDPDPLITASPVIDAPTLKQVHQLGPPPRNDLVAVDLVAVDLAVSSLDIAPEFKRPPVPTKGPPTKEEFLDAIFGTDLPRTEQRDLAREQYGEEVTEIELRNAEKKHPRKQGPQKRRFQYPIRK
jgi:hypothetical protein